MHARPRFARAKTTCQTRKRPEFPHSSKVKGDMGTKSVPSRILSSNML
jgi:hypothetical protein